MKAPGQFGWPLAACSLKMHARLLSVPFHRPNRRYESGKDPFISANGDDGRGGAVSRRDPVNERTAERHACLLATLTAVTRGLNLFLRWLRSSDVRLLSYGFMEVMKS